MAIARLLITADNKLALVAIDETAVASEEASGKIVASDERTAAANRETSASFADMKKGVSLLGTVAFGALAFGMDRSVKAAIAWQGQQVALQQVLKNTGQYSAAAMKDLNASVEHLATHGGFAEGDQITAITQLVGETHSLTAAQTLNAAATNLARGAHIDYASAVSKVETAMVGQTRGLGKLAGIVVPVTKYTYGWTAAMKAADAAGYAHAVTLNKQATAQEILGAVTKSYAGNITAYQKTTGAALSNLRNGFEILLRTLGVALLPTINRVASVFSGIGAWMTSHMGTVKTIAKEFLTLALAVGAIVTVWKLWTKAIEIQKALAATDPWLLALTAIAILAVEVVTHWKQVSGAVVSVFNAIGSAVTKVWDGLKRGFVVVINFITGMINKFIIAPLNAVLSLGGLFGGGPIPNIPSIGGSAPSAAGAGPNRQASLSANASVPATQHQAGGDIHHHITVQSVLDGRVVAENTVHQVQKKVALS
jgi:hypothetical protein